MRWTGDVVMDIIFTIFSRAPAFVVIYPQPWTLAMEKMTLIKCPVCKGVMDEVNYEESVGPTEYASYVLGSGRTLRGSVRKYVCVGCLSIQTFFVPSWSLYLSWKLRGGRLLHWAQMNVVNHGLIHDANSLVGQDELLAASSRSAISSDTVIRNGSCLEWGYSGSHPSFFTASRQYSLISSTLHSCTSSLKAGTAL